MNKLIVFLALVFSSNITFAADVVDPNSAPKYVDPNPWTHKTQRLDRNQIDKLLGHPEKLLFIDVRRPDELTKVGGFPIYLSIQIKNLPESLAYIPKDRKIITVSNRAHRAGEAGDLLLSNGFKVAGAAGVLDYQDQGGSLLKVAAPAPKPVAASGVPAATTAVPAAAPAAPVAPVAPVTATAPASVNK
jgi:rhodanese-related sulfurtransferase